MSGQQEQKPRWKRAMSVPNGLLGEAVGEMYVAKYFPERTSAHDGLVKNLQTASQTLPTSTGCRTPRRPRLRRSWRRLR